MRGRRRYSDAFRPLPTPGPLMGWYPGGVWGAGAPLMGWGYTPAPFAPVGYGRYPADYRPRRPPRESPTYGRGGDAAAQRYARGHGYDAGYTIRPHGRTRSPRARYGPDYG